LNRTARVMAAGHGGQILVAASAAALLDGVDLVGFAWTRVKVKVVWAAWSVK
jgi:hypothetical protein